MNIKNQIRKHLINIPGWRTRRKIVVIESDDWGSIRMPSREVYEKCLKAGYPVDKISYERYDSILSQDDLELLYELLSSFKDNNGNHPVITANCVVANPNFEKIRKDGFRNYHYELITETFKNYPKHQNNFNIWKQGIGLGVFFPQFHAKEHVNVSLFMKALQEGNPDAHWGFENGMPGSISKGTSGLSGNFYVEAMHYSSEKDKKEKLDIFLEGLDLFEKLFGYKSESIIPPNYIWSPDFDPFVFKKGVKYFQGNIRMKEPDPNSRPKFHTRFLGSRNIHNQFYLVRNVVFEPSMFRLKIDNPVENCLSAMSIAFLMNKPVIINSHRINFSGFIDKTNRDRTLRYLRALISTALKKWPEIEFLTSPKLGKIIEISKS